MFTYLGHTSIVFSSVFLEEEKAIATGDDNGSIAVWSIGKYLENEARVITGATQDRDTSDDDNGDQLSYCHKSNLAPACGPQTANFPEL